MTRHTVMDTHVTALQECPLALDAIGVDPAARILLAGVVDGVVVRAGSDVTGVLVGVKRGVRM